MTDETLAWIGLAGIAGVGPVSFHRLLTALGSVESVLGASVAQLQTIVPAPLARAIADGPEPAHLEQAAQWLQQPGNGVLTWADTDYPQQLLTITDPPPVLYFKGRRELLHRSSIAVVGSRNADYQGLENAKAFSQALSKAGLTVVSGLAIGIDTAAHRGGLTGEGSSIAVIGTGLDRVYPARNHALAVQLAERGLIVSEFPLGTPPLQANFPRRNRIISGLSRGVLVVQATLSSGSLITARLAAEQGREVFAIPGSIHSTLSKGCHRLIKDGGKLVEAAEDVLMELAWDPSSPLMASAAAPPVAEEATAAADESDPFLLAMGFDPVAVDVLCARLNASASEVTSRLFELELAGRVESLPGGRFQRTR